IFKDPQAHDLVGQRGGVALVVAFGNAQQHQHAGPDPPDHVASHRDGSLRNTLNHGTHAFNPLKRWEGRSGYAWGPRGVSSAGACEGAAAAIAAGLGGEPGWGSSSTSRPLARRISRTLTRMAPITCWLALMVVHC